MQKYLNSYVANICTYFHCMLFLLFFSMRPIPSKTLVMSYIRLFCLTASISAALNKNLKHAFSKSPEHKTDHKQSNNR